MNAGIHATSSLIRGLLGAALILGLPACGGSAGSEAGPEAGAEAGASLEPGEIPGVDDPGSPPPADPAPGENPQPEDEVPGVTAVPIPLPPPCANAARPVDSVLCDALDMELELIEANPPPNASERLEFLASLSSSPVEAATQLADYPWLSTTAEEVFGEAPSLLDAE